MGKHVSPKRGLPRWYPHNERSGEWPGILCIGDTAQLWGLRSALGSKNLFASCHKVPRLPWILAPHTDFLTRSDDELGDILGALRQSHMGVGGGGGVHFSQAEKQTQ